MDLALKQLLIPQRIYLDSALSSFYYVTCSSGISSFWWLSIYTRELLIFFLYFSLSKQYCTMTSTLLTRQIKATLITDDGVCDECEANSEREEF